MFIDASGVFSDSQAVTVTAVSTGFVDTLAAGDAYVGAWLVARVDVTFTAAGSATLSIDLQTDNNSSFSSPITLVTLGSTVAVATLTAHYLLKVRIPPGAERYLRVNYTVASGPMTAGNIDAFVTKDIDLLIT